MKSLFLVIVALFACASFLSAPTAFADRPVNTVTVTRSVYHGWHNCLKISNGIVEAIVVPQAGRILAFEYVGQPDTNPFWNDLNWSDKTIASVKPPDDASPGGDKIWPSQQGDWPRYIGSSWPPDPAIEWHSQHAVVIPNGVKMLGNPSRLYGIVMDRSITMKPGAAKLYLFETMRRISDPHPTAKAIAPRATAAIPTGIWNVSEVTGNSVAVLPLAKHSRLPNGLIVMMPAPTAGQHSMMPKGWSVNGDFLIGRRNMTDSNKLGTDSPEGWIAAWTGGSILLTEKIAGYKSGKYPDGGCDIEAYCSGATPPFIEMELLGPMRSLPIGRKEKLGVVWQLTKLSSKPASDIKLAKIAAKIAQGSR